MAARQSEERVPDLSGAERQRLAPIYAQRLEERYGDPHAALHFADAYQLLIAVILSAQTTDVGVNKATPALFERYPTPADLAARVSLGAHRTYYRFPRAAWHYPLESLVAVCGECHRRRDNRHRRMGLR